MQTFGELGSPVRSANDLPRLAREFPEERIGLLPFLYIDCSEKDLWFKANRDFADVLFERKFAYEYRQAPGDHVWPYWDKQLQEIMRAATETLATPEG